LWTLWQCGRAVWRTEDLSANLEKLLTEAEDCELIGKLTIDLRNMAHDIQAMISTRKQEAVSHTIEAGRMVPNASR
jgi:hypothetical protein